MDRDAVFLELQKQIRAVLPSSQDRAIQEGDRLADLGANSVDRMEIIVLTLEALNVRMPLTQAAKAQRIGDLVHLVQGHAEHA